MVAFDFFGHGRHPGLMSGDVSSVDGATWLLTDQIQSVIETLPADSGDIARIPPVPRLECGRILPALSGKRAAFKAERRAGASC